MRLILKTKRFEKRKAMLLRSFGSALVAVVIAVNIFGAFAGIVFADTTGVRNAINKANTSIQTMVKESQAALNAKTPAESVAARDKALLAEVAAGGALEEARNESYKDPEAIKVLNELLPVAESSFEQAKIAVTEASKKAESDAKTPEQKAELQTLQRTQQYLAPPTKTETTASHPIDVCLKTKSVAMCVASIFYVFFVDLTSPIAYLAGAVFDAFASISLESGTYASGVIAKGWVIARDIANMAFVFILIYVAFMLILNLEGVGIARQIAGVIAVALLINFSFFFTRVAIDVSNILAHEFYDQIVASPSDAKPSLLVAGVQATGIKSISEKVMAGVNPQQLISNKNFEKFLAGGSFFGNLAILITLFLIFGIINVILAAIFLTAAFQFLARIVALWFAIILSPIAFISFITPKMSGIWSKWLNLLLKNAFYAPAFLFVIYIATAMLDGGLLSKDISSFLGGSATQAGAGADSMKLFLNQIVGVILRLSIIVGLFIAALKVGEYVGVQGADRAEKWGKSLAIGGGAALVGRAGGFVGRNTAGRLGNFVARSDLARNLASGKTFGNSNFLVRGAGKGLGRGLEIAGYSAAKSSFDARALPLPEVGLGGKPQSGGYIKAVSDRAKAIEHTEHERHDSEAEKVAKERAIRSSDEFKAKLGAIDAEIASSQKEVTDSQANLALVTQKLAQARQSGTASEIADADAAHKEAEAAHKAAETRAEALSKGRSERIKNLDKEVSDMVGKNDKERKGAEVAHLASKGSHNLWGLSRASSDHAIGLLTKKESTKDKIAKMAKDLVKEEEGAEKKDDHGGGGGGGGAATPKPKPAAGPSAAPATPHH